MKNIRRLLALLLVLGILAGCIPGVSAANARITMQPRALTSGNFYIDADTLFYTDAATGGQILLYSNGKQRMKVEAGVNVQILPNGCYTKFIRESGFALFSPEGKQLTAYGQNMFWQLEDVGTGEKKYMTDGHEILDAQGKNPTGKRYQNIYKLENGLLYYGTETQKAGVDRIDGTQVLAAKYDGVLNLDYCTFRSGGKFGIRRIGDGAEVAPASYDEVFCHTGSDYISVKKNGLYGLFSPEGKAILPCEYQAAYWCGGSVVHIQKYGLWGLADTAGNILYPCEAEVSEISGAEYKRLNLLSFGRNDTDGILRWTVYRADGTCLLADAESELVSLAGDSFMAERGGDTDIYDLAGRRLNTVENAKPYVTRCSTYPCLYRDGRLALVGRDGQLTTDFDYSELSVPCDIDAICAKKGGNWYLLDRDGRDLLGYQLDACVMASEDGGYVAFSTGGKIGVAYVGQYDERVFRDVRESAWYSGAVEYCYLNGLMNGTSGTQFSPDATTTRAMIVTILYRMAGTPEAGGENPFTDVEAGKWYSDAVVWAYENDIVSGYPDGTFGPDQAITREQFAVILYNYAKAAGMDTSASQALTDFPDCRKVQSWADEALCWAVAEGLITGNRLTDAVYLQPQGKATRAMAATILMRFAQKTA